MRLQRTAMPAGQAWSPTASTEVSTLVAASGDGARGISLGRRSGGRAQDAPGQPAPGFSAPGSRQTKGGGAPGSGCGRPGRDGPRSWLVVSMVSLAVLAAAAAAVSYAAQYQMILAAKGSAPAAALEAAIPDVAALMFATLGIALALHGRRAIRTRILNVTAVATSVTMNLLAAGHGWRDLAVWAMPPIAYALASDTAIGVVRAWTIARQKALNVALADDEATPLAIVGGFLLWLLRLGIAPVSTLAGFRAWVVDECPVAPGRQARSLWGAPREAASSSARPITTRPVGVARQRGAGRGTKTARFLALVTDRYGPLGTFPLADVSRVSSELAPEVGLDPGAARSALRRHVLSLRNGSPR